MYHALSEILLHVGFYEETLEVSDKALEICVEAKSFMVFGRLLCNKARALYHLGNYIESSACFKKSYSAHMLHGNKEQASVVKKIVTQIDIEAKATERKASLTFINRVNFRSALFSRA